MSFSTEMVGMGMGKAVPLGFGLILNNVLAWRIPWTEDPGGLQSIGSQ